LRTPGGHRRYSRAAIRDVLAAGAEPDMAEERMTVTLRNRGGTEA
jgi:hypothetical protein